MCVWSAFMRVLEFICASFTHACEYINANLYACLYAGVRVPMGVCISTTNFMCMSFQTGLYTWMCGCVWMCMCGCECVLLFMNLCAYVRVFPLSLCHWRSFSVSVSLSPSIHTRAHIHVSLRKTGSLHLYRELFFSVLFYQTLVNVKCEM